MSTKKSTKIALHSETAADLASLAFAQVDEFAEALASGTWKCATLQIIRTTIERMSEQHDREVDEERDRANKSASEQDGTRLMRAVRDGVDAMENGHRSFSMLSALVGSIADAALDGISREHPLLPEAALSRITELARAAQYIADDTANVIECQREDLNEALLRAPRCPE